MKRQGVLLATTIMAVLESGLFLLLLLFIMVLGSSPDFADGFEEGYASTAGADVSFSAVVMLFVFIAIYSVIKFIFVLLSYRSNKRGFIITAMVLTALPVLNYLISLLFLSIASLIPLIYSGTMLALLIIGFINLKKMRDNDADIVNTNDYNDITIEMDGR